MRVCVTSETQVVVGASPASSSNSIGGEAERRSLQAGLRAMLGPGRSSGGRKEVVQEEQ